VKGYFRLARDLVTALLVGVVRAYRAALTPFFGPCCRFEPSCSAYTEECLRIHGPLLGAWLGLRRILRCHPFSAGGLDPVPAGAGAVVQQAAPATLAFHASPAMASSASKSAPAPAQG
jgi:uncharacterized protein